MEVMYLVQQPTTLETLATDQLAQWIASQATLSLVPLAKTYNPRYDNTRMAERMLLIKIKMIRDYLERHLACNLHDKLASVLSSLLFKIEQFLWKSSCFNKYGGTAIGRFIETLFTKNLTRLSSCGFEETTAIYFPSLCSKLHMVPSLTELKLSDRHLNAQNTEAEAIKVLQRLHSLKHLILSWRYNGFNNIIRCISEHCKSIEVLELWSDNPFLENCFNMLTELRYLRKLELHVCGVSEKGIATLLMSCENLEHMSIRLGTLADALGHMRTFDQNSEKRLKLRSHIDGGDLTPTLRQLQLVVQMCPHIQEIRLIRNKTEQNLLTLTNFQELRELTLLEFHFYGDNVDALLQIRGLGLTLLHLQSLQQIDLKALMLISETCPNLQTLTIWSYRNSVKRPYVSILSQTPNLLSAFNKFHQIPSFTNLKRIYLRFQYEDYISEEQLFFLLSSCPNIESIMYKAGRSRSRDPLTDNFWLNVLNSNPMTYLKELKLCIDDDSMPSTLVIDRIVQNSINRPVITCQQ